MLCLSFYLSFSIWLALSVPLFVCLCLCLCLYFCLCLGLPVSICLSVSVSVTVCLCLSDCLYLSLRWERIELNLIDLNGTEVTLLDQSLRQSRFLQPVHRKKYSFIKSNSLHTLYRQQIIHVIQIILQIMIIEIQH